MDIQSTPTPEQPRVAPEVVGAPIMPVEQAPAPTPVEAAPQPSPAPQNAGAPAGPPAAHLTAQDVAAAIAATPTSPAPVSGGGIPAAAADVDVVEPEWVNAAEQVIAQTAGNPYAEEEAFETLQVDYLKKRYGHEVNKPEGK